MGKQLLISGCFGFQSTGDEAVLSALLRGMKRRDPSLSFMVTSSAPERTRSLHGVDAISWSSPFELIEAARAADVLVVGGGDLAADVGPLAPESILTPSPGNAVYTATLPVLARAYGKRSAILGVGVGPLANAQSAGFARSIFTRVDLATVRDPESLAVLERIGAARVRNGASVRVTSDLAFALEGVAPRAHVSALLQSIQVPADRPLVVVALRGSGPKDHAVAALAEGLDIFLQRCGGHALFLPFQHDLALREDDARVARAVSARLAPSTSRTVLEFPVDLDMTRGLIESAVSMLTLRHHAALFAIARGLEPVALAYEPELDALMRRVGLERSILALGALSGPIVAAALERAHRERDAARLRLMAARTPLVELANENLTALEALCAEPASEPDLALQALVEASATRYEHMTRARANATRAEAEVERLRRELEAIRGSNSFKMARRLRDLSVSAAPAETMRRGLVSTGLGLVRETRRLGARGLAKKYVPSTMRGPIEHAYHRVRALQASDRRAKDQQSLRSILSENPGVRDVFVLAPSISWNVALFQRPQQLAMALARLGVLVFYVEPGRTHDRHGFVKHAERLYLARVDREVFDVLDDYTLYVLSWTKAWTERLHPSRTVYDFIDDLDVFNTPDRAQLARDHQTLLEKATVVSATAALLHEEVLVARPDAILCPNGVDFAHFSVAKAQATPAPEDIQDILALGKPIVGYYGALARWFDYDLLWSVASKRPDLFFLLIGPDYDKTLTHQSLFHLPNVRWLGPRPYTSLPSYLARFDVATVPFKVNAITHATSPLKLFEYMAGGRPIVTTPMRESMRYENVLVGEGPEGFSAKLTQALALRHDSAHRALTERIALENTWDERAEQLLRALGRSGEPKTRL